MNKEFGTIYDLLAYFIYDNLHYSKCHICIFRLLKSSIPSSCTLELGIRIIYGLHDKKWHIFSWKDYDLGRNPEFQEAVRLILEFGIIYNYLEFLFIAISIIKRISIISTLDRRSFRDISLNLKVSTDLN